jgi:mannosyltransferase
MSSVEELSRDEVASTEKLPRRKQHFWLVMLLVVFATTALDLFFSVFRSLWSDEAFTAIASTLDLHDFWHLILDKQDAVNATYDLLMRPYVLSVGHGTFELRVPSAIFMAVACAGIMVIARSLVGTRVAIITGLAFTFMPLVAGYGSEARSYALSAAVVTWSTWFALRFLYDHRRSRLWAWCYGASLVLTGYVFFYAFSIVVVHLFVAVSETTSRRRARTLLLIQCASALAILPLVVVSRHQQQEISWIPSGLHAMITNGVGVFITPFWSGVAATPFPELLTLLVWGVITWGLLRLVSSSGWSEGARIAVRLGLAWALVPGLLFSLASLAGPYFTLRYIVFCVPAVALLLGIAIAQISSGFLRGGLIVTLVMLIAFADAPLLSNTGKDGWGTTMNVLKSFGAPNEFVLPTPQTSGDDYGLDARVTGLPHQMTLIDFENHLPWTTAFTVQRWSSSSVPPTHVIWLVSRFGIVGCSELSMLRKWGFAVVAKFGTDASPTYKFVAPRPTVSSSINISCTSQFTN